MLEPLRNDIAEMVIGRLPANITPAASGSRIAHTGRLAYLVQSFGHPHASSSIKYLYSTCLGNRGRCKKATIIRIPYSVAANKSVVTQEAKPSCRGVQVVWSYCSSKLRHATVEPEYQD
jgi:hypothetical protein